MIPPVAHFVWLGADFPWLNVLAVRSAALRGGFERVVVHLGDPIESARRRELEAIGNVELRRVELRPLLGADRLLTLYGQLTAPAARSNVLRAAILAREGGVYLDMDTVTIGDLSAIRGGCGAFCGLEHVAFPGHAGVASFARGLVLSGVRAGLRRVPRGFRWFRRVQHLYPLAANNAVLGAAPGHRLVGALLERMARMPRQAALRRFALGTHLLQETLRECPGGDVRVFGPELFYPLGPEISRYWFGGSRAEDLGRVLSPETRVVHWYASHHTRAEQRRFGPGHAGREGEPALLSRLLEAFDLLDPQKKPRPAP